jgi:predicted membrane protein (TIGR00267 family)
MMRYELGLEKPDANRARKSALTIGASYIVGGLIPLLPYVFIRTDKHLALLVSLVVTLLALFVFGFFKSKVTGQPPISGAFRTMIIGAIAAGAAFGIAKLVGG